MTDSCDRDGAEKLKQKIEEYWASRGFDASIDLVDAGFVPAMRSARTDVRSKMVNGMPQRRKGGARVQPTTSQKALPDEPATTPYPKGAIASRMRRER